MTSASPIGRGRCPGGCGHVRAVVVAGAPCVLPHWDRDELCRGGAVRLVVWGRRSRRWKATR